MATSTLNFTITYVTQVCVNAQCGLSFAVPKEWDDLRRKDHQPFYCPNGHKQWYSGETAQERKIRELEEQAKRLRQQNNELWTDYSTERGARLQVQRRLSATKGVLTRTRNRVARGVCPCCNRSFAQLARHMATQHPDYAAPADGEEGGDHA